MAGDARCKKDFHGCPRNLIGLLLVIAISWKHLFVCGRFAYPLSFSSTAQSSTKRFVAHKGAPKKTSMVIPCSRLAALAGFNPHQSPADEWRYIFKSSYGKKYRALIQQEPLLMTTHDHARIELDALEPDTKQNVREIQQLFIESQQPCSLDIRSVAPTLSLRTAKLLEGEVSMRRGVKSQKEGLSAMESVEKELVKGFRAEIKSLENEVAALDEQCKERVAEASSQSEAIAIEEDFLKRKTGLQTQVSEVAALLSQYEVPIDLSGGSSYRSYIGPSVVLAGKLDAWRTPEGEHHIIEHKARQKRLFKELNMYDKIQCLGYMHLVRRAKRESQVRCFLVETFEDQVWRGEVKPDPSLWKDGVLNTVNQRAKALRSLAETENVDANDVLSWLRSLNAPWRELYQGAS